MPSLDEGVPPALLRAAYPPGTRIVEVRSYRPGYRSYPARVTVRTPDGTLAHGVLDADADAGTLAREARVLGALSELGLPVPTVLAGPVPLARDGHDSFALLVSELPGEPLPWIRLNDLEGAHLTCRLVGEGVDRLHGLTDAVRAHEIGGVLPRHSLAAEFEAVRGRDGPWRDLTVFRDALGLLEATLPDIAAATPLVFSNGDYNPLNFLHVGPELTGWVDFENACFEDPYIGFAKFLLWAADGGWEAGVRAGLVERYLYAHDVAPTEFLPRLVLRGLRHLQEGALAKPQDPFTAQRYLLAVLADAVTRRKKRTGPPSRA